MIEWHFKKLEGRLLQVQRRLDEALDVLRDPTKNKDYKLGFAISALEGASHDIGFTLDIHGQDTKEDIAWQEGLFKEPPSQYAGLSPSWGEGNENPRDQMKEARGAQVRR